MIWAELDEIEAKIKDQYSEFVKDKITAQYYNF